MQPLVLPAPEAAGPPEFAVNSQKTTLLKKGQVPPRQWWVVDAADQVLGRVTSRIALLLRGKHKPSFTPHVECGDHVIVLNASRIRLTGKKEETKAYHRTSGRPGGLKTRSFRQMRAERPERILEHALRGMLPKNRLGRRMIRHVMIYPGDVHPHGAQNPQPLKLG